MKTWVMVAVLVLIGSVAHADDSLRMSAFYEKVFSDISSEASGVGFSYRVAQADSVDIGVYLSGMYGHETDYISLGCRASTVIQVPLDLGVEIGCTYIEDQFRATLGISFGVIGTSQTNYRNL